MASTGFLLLFGMLVVAGCAPLAAAASGTETVNEDEYIAHEFSFPSGGGKLTYKIEVTSGPKIDVFLMTRSEYTKFVNDETCKILVDGSKENTRLAERTDVQLDEGSYVLVIDNTDYGEAIPPVNMVNDPATVTYEINTKESVTEAEMMLCLMAAVIGVVLSIVVVVVLVIVVRKKRTVPPVPPPQALQYPVMAPPQQGAVTGPPPEYRLPPRFQQSAPPAQVPPEQAAAPAPPVQPQLPPPPGR